jgi:uncharacterized repeat protein (TIGR01451 family)
MKTMHWNTRFVQALVALGCGIVASATVAATPAGTLISNMATITYAYPSTGAVVQQTNTTSFRVLQVLDLAVASAEVGPALVSSPDAQRAIAFQVTNIGNGPDVVRLNRVDNVAGDQFNPRAAAIPIYIESGATPGLQLTGPNADLAYTPGSNDVALAAGQSKHVYVVSAIDAGLPNLAQGRTQLLVESTLPGAAGGTPGAPATGFRIAGIEAIVGATRARADATWAYQISGVRVKLDKQLSKVLDPQGGSSLVPGAIMSYRVSVIVQGTGTATNLEFSDPLPIQTRYRPGSIRVAGVVKTDAADSDNASFDGVKIIAALGDLNAPAQVDVEFETVLQ